LLVCIDKQDSELNGPFEIDAGWKKKPRLACY